MTKLSVVIPVYNTNRYLRECLNSVLGQTIKDLEVILVDDGSTDGSLEIEKEYARSDKRIKIVEKAHSNAGECRNVGMRVATGEYLAFLDSDDVFSPEMFATMVQLMESSTADVVTCGFLRFQNGERNYNLCRNGTSFDFSVHNLHEEETDLFSRYVGWAWDKLFRRDFVQKYNLKFQEIVSSNDLSFVYSALTLSRKVVDIAAPFVAHRTHRDSLQANRRKDPSNFLKALESYRVEMGSRKVFEGRPTLYRQFLQYVVRFSIYQLDTVTTIKTHNDLRKAIVSYWTKVGVGGEHHLMSGTFAIRRVVVARFPLIELLYVVCFKSWVMNPLVRGCVKKLVRSLKFKQDGKC